MHDLEANDETLDRVIYYHDGTKHHFQRFARSLGYLDWASQPRPFRSFHGSPAIPIFPAPQSAPLADVPGCSYDALYGPARAALPISEPSIGFFLRHALGLSAWKAIADSRWSLRVNPSSGNLHPTEAYVICADRVWHYDARHHALEERCVFDAAGWTTAGFDRNQAFVVALTSIHWRESWKYGERAFRYCHHDIGHAIGALRLSAALCGWSLRVLPGWPQRAIATMTGVDREPDFVDAEPEDPACALIVTPGTAGGTAADPPDWNDDAEALVTAIRRGTWTGHASQLSEEHVQWTFIDEIAHATSGDGRGFREDVDLLPRPLPGDRGRDAAAVILQRRSAVALDGRTSIERQLFFRMLARLMPGATAPWDALWWPARIHLAIFVHRVIDLEPGLYLLIRNQAAEPLLRTALGSDASWIRMSADLPLWRLAAGDCRRLAQRLSCDQEIAGDGAFSLAMLAEFTGSLATHGTSFYRRLYWECGLIGQVLYLEAEAAGIRGTGIGCFYDDAVHEALGISDHAVQSLYHFTVGGALDDSRLMATPGYSWETAEAPGRAG